LADSSDLSKLRIARESTLARAGSRRWRLLGWSIAAVLLLGGVVLILTRINAGAVEVEAITVSLAYPYQSLTVLNATGYVVAQRKAAVASKASGRLEWLGVQEGSVVQQGQVIARLESQDMSAARDQAAANVKVTRANVEQARAEHQEARRALVRSEELLQQSFVSRSAHDSAIGREHRARAALRAAQATVGVAEANLRAAQVAYDQTVIRAPFDGVVLTKNANVGDTITPFSSALDTKGAVVTMADMSTLEVEADVSESNLAAVKVGQPCAIELDALPEARFSGHVSRTVPTVDRSKATVSTRIRFDALDPRILPEMSAKVAFLSQEVSAEARGAHPAVNASAVVRRDGRELVYVIRDGKAVATSVRTGRKLAVRVELLDGPPPGTKVVLRPPERLVDGRAIKLAHP
jgi:RND family efflux transporter MFP subunit